MTAKELEERSAEEPVFIRDYPFDEPLPQLYEFILECENGEWKEIQCYELREETIDFATKGNYGEYYVYARSFDEAVEKAKQLEAEEG